MQVPQVLMIDDSQTDAFLMKRALKKIDANNEFRWIGDAVDGFRELSENEEVANAVIFLDIKMPKMTGLEVLAKLHEQGALKRIRKINVLSSSELTKDIETALQYENVAFYTKPEGYTSLCTMLSDILASSAKDAA